MIVDAQVHHGSRTGVHRHRRHIPPGIYDVPHFDIHFYIQAIEEIFAIQRGPCGLEFVRCDQFARAKLPLPKNYMNADFKNVDAVVAVRIPV